ncbi:hypothetical protein KJ996_05650, partial [Patescibacteria group bacterium]|nr:hypothetical protein [Patescibacteria group bacterium]
FVRPRRTTVGWPTNSDLVYQPAFRYGRLEISSIINLNNMLLLNKTANQGKSEDGVCFCQRKNRASPIKPMTPIVYQT